MTMKEIDILRRAISKGCLLVDKTSHVLLGKGYLLAAQGHGLYQEEDTLSAPGKQEVNGPYPGCTQFSGASKEFTYQLVGQTKHVAIFACPRKASAA
jgi:hypothetical protein